MSIAFVEANTGDVLRVTIAGRILENLVIGLTAYFDEQGDEAIKKDFAVLEVDPPKRLIDYCKPLAECYYACDCDYAEDEYDFYRHRTHDTHTSEEEFKTMVRYVKSCWRDIDKVMEGISVLLSRLMHLSPMEGDWFGDATIEELQALYDTCQLARTRDAEQVRIKFEY
jgi:hypothetical protein